jgi:predicted Fe-Mo cluster-binding NifX family protein
MTKQNQIVAFPIIDGRVSHYFGKAPQVYIATIVEGRKTYSTVIDLPKSNKGAKQLFLRDYGCTDVVCCNIGTEDRNKLHTLGIRVFSGIQEWPPDRVLEVHLGIKYRNYKIVTLCGSTRFKEQFMEVQKRLTLEGCIVISVGMFGHSGDEEVWKPGVKEMLDDMHLRKIDLADEIFVINVGGYIGESTRREIEYAKNNMKKVNYLEKNRLVNLPIR